MFISHLPAREQELFLAYFVIGGDVSEGQEHCRAVGKAQRQLPPAQDDEMRDVGSCFKPFTQDWVLPAGFGAQPWLQNTWGLRAAWTILFQPHAAPIHPVQQWSRSVILSPHPPGASFLPTWTPTVMLWHHQSPLPACTHCIFLSGLAAHAE